MICGYLSASFDLLNISDLDVISQVRQRCSRLVVGVYSDAYVERVSGRPPVIPLEERLMLVSHIRGVDAAVIHDATGGLPAQSDIVFKRAQEDVTDLEPTDSGPGTICIEPQRHTKSRELRAALAHVTAGEVCSEGA